MGLFRLFTKNVLAIQQLTCLSDKSEVMGSITIGVQSVSGMNNQLIKEVFQNSIFSSRRIHDATFLSDMRAENAFQN